MPDKERLDSWKRYGLEQRRAEKERMPTFLRIPEPRIRTGSFPRSFSLGDLNPRNIRLPSERYGFDGFSVALSCAISFAAGIVTCRILQAFF